MALSGLLSIARTALQTHQRAVDVTGHNIANAGTEGYSRQRLRLVPQTPLRHPLGFIGRGVDVDGIERARNRFLDGDVRRESGEFAQFSNLRATLGELETIFGEPSDFGLAATLDAFWSSWGDLATNPTDTAARAVVRSRGQQLAAQFNMLSRQVDTVRENTLDGLRADTAAVNSLARRIADLNRSIVSAGAGGENAPDLLDQRDLLLDQLAEYGPIRVTQDNGGSVRVIVGDVLMVDGSETLELTVTNNTRGEIGVAIASDGSPVRLTSGKIAAELDLLATAIPEVVRQLDDLAGAVVRQVNTLHRGGATLAGQPAGDFFNASGVSANSIALSYGVGQSASAIAAGTGSGPGDSSIALGIASLRNAALGSLGNQTVGDYYVTLLTSLGADVAEAEGFAAVHETLAASAEERRASVSGVSIDEEMVNLIVNQQAYAAAARLVTVADEMIQEVLRMG